MLSFWEKKHFLNHDMIIIGAGIVGLSTAIQYKIRFPKKSVLVLERGVFPSGASTKNAGFACFGSLTEILDDLKSMSDKEVFELVEKRYRGLLAIRKFFGDEAIGYKSNGGMELIIQSQENVLSEISRINGMLFPIFEDDVFEVLDDVQPFRFGPNVKYIIKNKFEGELDTGLYLQRLWSKCQSLDVKILTGAKVDSLDVTHKKVYVKNGLESQVIPFQAKQIAICTNAFTDKLIPDLDIKPGRGLILVTKPLKDKIDWQGAFHYDEGYVYFRALEGNRLMMGGGRNLDFDAEQTDQFEINQNIKAYLVDLIRKVIMPKQQVEIEMEWSGIMAFGTTKKPIITMLNDDVGLAVRLGGMGVAIGWQTAEELVSNY
ncbi:FAD-binding oxidoreductase [Belliella sp. R4-6]|uniref:FAD-binding oxidoreductase n=1 Tax=Belliella alkalica TaxID=1730871 RepID=A0ABS9VFD8_9BACT|nr:FAD-dependent oxidoreductase [Belliella alkalica]MCH7415162.1 FAD-binding oxidoreductase [Belliella alkalica]